MAYCVCYHRRYWCTCPIFVMIFAFAGWENCDDLQLQDILLQDGMMSRAFKMGSRTWNGLVSTNHIQPHHEFAGEKQPEAAAAALNAILVERKNAYRITLRSKDHNQRITWTLFEMWQATVSRLLRHRCACHALLRHCRPGLHVHRISHASQAQMMLLFNLHAGAALCKTAIGLKLLSCVSS